MSQISFVYFDVGGVAIRDFSDSNKWDIMLDNVLGIKPEFRPIFDQIYDKYEDDICLGKIGVDDLKPYIREQLNHDLDPNFSLLKYFIDNFEQNTSLWPIVHECKDKYKVGLLTDQYLGMLDGITAKQLLPPEPWDAIVDSSVLGVRKPMTEIYVIAENMAQVPAQEILFVDNREKNLVPARARGWQTFFYNSRDYDKSSQELAAFLSRNS